MSRLDKRMSRLDIRMSVPTLLVLVEACNRQDMIEAESFIRVDRQGWRLVTDNKNLLMLID